jgi:hypothetical protein
MAGCCARAAATSHAVDEPTIPLMKSRRRIVFPKTTPITCGLFQAFAIGEMGV